MSYPSQWQTFCKWNRANGVAALPAHIDLSKLNRFAARYRLAKNFRGLDVEGYANASTGEAYSSVMLAFLAYSALEQLHEATKESPKQHLHDRWAALAIAPSAKLRRAKKILLFLQAQMNSRHLQGNLQAFIDGKTDNSLYVASALRNAVAHGFMSVHPKATSPGTASRFCDQISAMLIAIADTEFTDLVKSLTQPP